MRFNRLQSLVRPDYRHILVILLILLSSLSFSQNVTLTPEQQSMLNQLPAAQRQEALQAIQRLQRQGQNSSATTTLIEDLSSAPTVDESALEGMSANGELRVVGGTNLIVTLTLKPELVQEGQDPTEDDAVLQALEGSNFYVLNDAGMLELPGLPLIPLLGLTADQIQQRLQAESVFDVFDVFVTILESIATGGEALEPFGYELFESGDYNFDPVITGPVPTNYVLGPGDTVRVQLFGNVNDIYETEVSRDGLINLSQLGPVSVAGLTFAEFRQDINQRVSDMLIGTQVSVTMGRLSTIRVFVLGDVNRPGSYVVSSLATMSSALYRSGGISRVGTLRNIQLKRNGDVVSQLDMYDLLINGDTSGDSRLQPGDVIFVPTIGAQVSVGGAAKRPAIYESRIDESIADVIELAGGFAPEAYPDGTVLERIESGMRRTVISLDADGEEASNTRARAGDIVTIPEVLPDLEDAVRLEGHVHRSGTYQWRAGMRLTDLIYNVSTLKPGADTEYVLIRQEDAVDRSVRVVSADLSAAWGDLASVENVRLQPRDTVYVFSTEFSRQRFVQPIIDELFLQSDGGLPAQVVSIGGSVKMPGSYPLESDMRVSDLIRAGGSLSEEAYTLEAELTRYTVSDAAERATEVIEVDLGAILRGDNSADLILSEHDFLRINTVPEWNTEWTVNLDGEVRFPGEYRIRRGENLRQLLTRAGGLTDNAFPEGAIFLRESLRVREQEQIDLLADRMEADLTSLSLESQNTTGTDSLSTGRELLAQLRSTVATGRLVIDITNSFAGGNADDETNIELRDQDRLLIPTRSQVVTVIGETQQNTSHLYQSGLSRDAYIEKSGGLTRRADKKLIYVVRASGAVIARKRSQWFSRAGGVEIQPGDTIVVPLEIDRVKPLAFWGSVTQILYQAAIAVAAIQTFND